MKRIILLAVAVVLFSSGAFAQIQRKTDTAQSVNSKKRHHDMMAQLDLSKDQKEKMKEIRKENKSNFDAIKNDNTLTGEQKKAEMVKLRMEQKRKMNSILTSEQQQKMKAYKKDHPRKHGKKMKGMKHGDKKAYGKGRVNSK